MREMNRALVLEIIRREKAVSRTDLARHSALTKPTVWAIVDTLLDEGLVHEVGFGVSPSRRGRRARLFELNDAAAAFVGIHFGVRHTSIAVADSRGRIRAKREVGTFRGHFGRAVRAVPALVKEAMREAKLSRSRLEGVGVAIPGLVDQTTGKTLFERKALRAEADYPEGDEASGRRQVIQRIVNDMVEGAQSQW